MTSVNDGPSWDEQWGSDDGGDVNSKAPIRYRKKGASNMEKMKSVAKKSFTKAKKVAASGAVVVKSHAQVGLKWLQKQYRKRTSKKQS